MSPLDTPSDHSHILPSVEAQNTHNAEQEEIQLRTMHKLANILRIGGMDLEQDKEKLLAIIAEKKNFQSKSLTMSSTPQTNIYKSKAPELAAKLLARQNFDKSTINTLYAETYSMIMNNDHWSQMPVESAYGTLLMVYARYFQTLGKPVKSNDGKTDNYINMLTDSASDNDIAKSIVKLEQGNFAHFNFGREESMQQKVA